MTEQLVRDSLTELKSRIGELQVFCGNFLHQFGVALSAGVGIGDPEHPVHDVDGYRRNPVTPCCYKSPRTIVPVLWSLPFAEMDDEQIWLFDPLASGWLWSPFRLGRSHLRIQPVSRP